MITLVVNGIAYTNFVSAQCTRALTTIANDFTFTASAVSGFPPFKEGEEIEVFVDNEKILTGYIDEITGGESSGSHTVVYSGRDKTGDLIDSQLRKFDDVKAGDSLTLKRIIELVLKNINLDLEVIDNFNPPPFNSAEDIVDAKDGMPATDLIMEYARKRQSLISSDEDGNIVISQSSPSKIPTSLQRRLTGDNNNILRQNWKIDTKLEFNRYILRAQLDPRALNLSGAGNISGMEDQGGDVINDTSRAGRQRVIVVDKSYSSEQLKIRAQWEKQLAKSKAITFNCTVAGHTIPGIGGIWTENKTVQVNSEVADISREMLINTVTFTQSEGEVSLTELALVEKNIYNTNEKILSQKPVGSLNDSFRSLG